VYRVAHNYVYNNAQLYIYGVYTVCLAGKSPNIWCVCTVLANPTYIHMQTHTQHTHTHARSCPLPLPLCTPLCVAACPTPPPWPPSTSRPPPLPPPLPFTTLTAPQQPAVLLLTTPLSRGALSLRPFGRDPLLRPQSLGLPFMHHHCHNLVCQVGHVPTSHV